MDAAAVNALLEQNKALIEALQVKTNTSSKSISGVNIEKYDECSENWDAYIQRFEAFLDIQNVSEENRGKALISSLSPKLFSLLRSLIAPINPVQKKFNELKEILGKHLNPKPLIIPSRHAFLNRKQREGESISTYIAELRTLAVPCCYNDDMLNIMLRDVFVSGLRQKAILDRLFEEDDTDLEKTVSIALALEKAVKGANDIFRSTNHSINEIKVTSPPRKPKKGYTQNNASKNTYLKNENDVCTRCNSKFHKASDCKHKFSVCNFCRKVGHIKPACFTARKAKPKQQSVVNQKQVNAEICVDYSKSKVVPMYTVKTEDCKFDKNSPIMLNLEIENKPVGMELDTGAAVSAMSADNFRKISNKKIKRTELIFKTYKGDIITPLGYALVSVKYKNQKYLLKLFIVKEDVDTIFGRDWLYKIKIDWPSIKLFQHATSTKNQLSTLLENYEDLFDDKVGEIQNYTCKLELKPDAKPVFCRPRPVPFALKQRVEDELDRLEKEGIIEKTSISEWATPIVPVVKRDGGIRLCADYSVTLNKNLKVQQHPLPKIEEIFASLSDGKVFSKVDFSQAYLQMKMHADSQKLLTINTHKGLYVCKRLMYGVNAAPAIWQKYIEGVFQGLEGTEVFFDDARIAAPDAETHFKRLEKFFQICRQNGLKINKVKSKFFQSEIQFLGFKVNAQGLSKTDEKISAIMNAETPKNVHDIQSFMGLVNFYGRFSKELATLAYPLHNLTKKGVPWKWDKSCEEAFKKIKKEICSDRVLTHYNPDLPIVLSTDASPVGLGACLAHRFPDGSEHPIAFASRTLSRTEQKYSQIDKEALAIVWGVQKFYLYLKGVRFTLITDHKPLVAIFGSKKGLPVLSATRLLHYSLVLQAYQFDIEYRPTKEHGNADFLSRLPLKSEELEIKDDVSIFQLNQIETLPITYKDLGKATLTDDVLKPIFHTLREGGSLEGKEGIQYTLEGDCILYGSRVCVPKCFQHQVLEELHAGHLGVVKMKAIARSYVYWKNIDKDIEEIARNCKDCAVIKSNPDRAAVHYWEYPSSPWERIHIDYAGPFFEHMILIIVDAHSKWLEAYPLKTATSHVTIECLRDCFARFGLPITLVSDNGSQFTSDEFEIFLKMNGIKHKFCAPYKPSSNGQAERYVYTVKQSLRAVKNYPGSIRQKLSTFLMQYRKTPHATTGHSPAMLLMKREIRTRIDLLRPDLRLNVQDRIRKDRFSFVDRSFNIGEKVAVRNYRSPDCKWKFGTVVSRDGHLHYTINVAGQFWRRHIDQIRRSGEAIPPSEPEIPASHFRSSKEESSQNVPDKDESTPSIPDVTDNSSDQQTIPDQPLQPPIPEPVKLRRSSRVRKPPDRLNL